MWSKRTQRREGWLLWCQYGSKAGKMIPRRWQGSDPTRGDGGELDQLGWMMVLRGASLWQRSRLMKVWSSSSSSLPPAPAGGGGSGGGAAASSISAAGLVLAQFRPRLPATVVTVIVAMVLLVERYRSRHAAGRSWYEPRVSEFLAAYLSVCVVS